MEEKLTIKQKGIVIGLLMFLGISCAGVTWAGLLVFDSIKDDMSYNFRDITGTITDIKLCGSYYKITFDNLTTIPCMPGEGYYHLEVGSRVIMKMEQRLPDNPWTIISVMEVEIPNEPSWNNCYQWNMSFGNNSK